MYEGLAYGQLTLTSSPSLFGEADIIPLTLLLYVQHPVPLHLVCCGLPHHFRVLEFLVLLSRAPRVY